MKLAAVVLVLVVLYAVALELVPWTDVLPAVLAVPASIATVLAVVLIGALLAAAGCLTRCVY